MKKRILVKGCVNMKYIILYFSGTGNTQLIAEEIKNRLVGAKHNVELVSIENKGALLNLNFENKVIGFGYPVYKFSYPDKYDEVLAMLNELAKYNHYFQFSTYARFDANAFYDFSSKLDKEKFKFIGSKSFKAPSCGISARKAVDDYEYESVMFFEDKITHELDTFVNEISNEKMLIERSIGKPIWMSSLKKIIVKDIEITKYPRMEINADQCTMCGLCVNACPDNNLKSGQTYIEIDDEVGCLHCLRCMNHCPSNAITFGELTVGENQYDLKTRNELFRKSSEGYCEKYWQEFEPTVSKWRKRTLGYWITHRFRRV